MTEHERRGPELARQGRLPAERVALVDLLDRLLAGGVVVTGDLVLSIADIDLVRISLRALITSVRDFDSEPGGEPHGERAPGAGGPAEPAAHRDRPRGGGA
ncbi:hypothetical protein Misp01_70900 [Microtetraspora sp. NBRC 13810]|uniref:gas vesicle protein n=1 Tax=Microtetraspora sp. NBRC 13810 TaxID=3030990 RepID=UPI0024A43D9F|nr:gas vesicle protein [Microtetraspora sp. NBRC 13810]GLW11962.1 hypothetical protein Misp01_70900 [Microtetraspora sp. NBRC 13810]